MSNFPYLGTLTFPDASAPLELGTLTPRAPLSPPPPPPPPPPPGQSFLRAFPIVDNLRAFATTADQRLFPTT